MVKNINTIQTTYTSDLVKQADYNTKIDEIEKKKIDHDHEKYITTQEANKLTAENFAARLKQTNLKSKSNISDFLNKVYFDNILENLNKKVTLNKSRHVEVNNLDDLSKKVKLISTKWSTKDLINNLERCLKKVLNRHLDQTIILIHK